MLIRRYSKAKLDLFKKVIRSIITNDQIYEQVIYKINECNEFEFNSNSLTGKNTRNHLDEFRVIFEPSIYNSPIVSTFLSKKDGSFAQSQNIYFFDDTCGIIMVVEQTVEELDDRIVNISNQYLYTNNHLNYAFNSVEDNYQNGDYESTKTEKIIAKDNKSYKMVTTNKDGKENVSYYKLDYHDSDLHFNSQTGNGKYTFSSTPATRDTYIAFNSQNVNTQVRRLIAPKNK